MRGRRGPNETKSDSRRTQATSPADTGLFFVLFSLADGENHGYAIMQDMAALSGDKFRMGPGTPYSTLQRLLDLGLIEEVRGSRNAAERESRRRRYRVTGNGQTLLEDELSIQRRRRVSVAKHGGDREHFVADRFLVDCLAILSCSGLAVQNPTFRRRSHAWPNSDRDLGPRSRRSGNGRSSSGTGLSGCFAKAKPNRSSSERSERSQAYSYWQRASRCSLVPNI